MSTNRLSIRIPASAVRELEDVARMDWSDGITLPDLLNWINTQVARFRPDGSGGDSRAGAEFTPRTLPLNPARCHHDRGRNSDCRRRGDFEIIGNLPDELLGFR